MNWPCFLCGLVFGGLFGYGWACLKKQMEPPKYTVED